ncbi:MAG: DUF4093 domain-containing protein [Ruminococcus sp.]|nr:DUF4093 domain-containing protein [Ruminococcus sp.]
MEKLKLSQAVIVEGKYDKIKLSAILDAVIITTEGFHIFDDSETAKLIKKYASTAGIIILTDSDAAGFRIRSHIKSICPEGKITNIYIPDVYGKEHRKAAPSKEGKLGVEGIDVQVLRELFVKAGAAAENSPQEEKLTMQDFFELGLSGGSGSSVLRRALAAQLSLPERITAKAMLDAVNTIYGKSEFIHALELAKEETGL